LHLYIYIYTFYLSHYASHILLGKHHFEKDRQNRFFHKLPEGQNISTLFINNVADANVGGGKIAKKARKRSKRQVVIAGKSTTNARYGLLIGADAFREPDKRSFDEADLVVLPNLPAARTFESDILRKRKKARRRNPATTTGEIANALPPGPGELYTNYTGL
jgi:hypothetical protein